MNDLRSREISASNLLGGGLSEITFRAGSLQIVGWVDFTKSVTVFEIHLSFLLNGNEINQTVVVSEVGLMRLPFTLVCPLDKIDHLINLQLKVVARHAEQTLSLLLPDGPHDLLKLQMQTPQQCLRAIQNPAYRIQDRATLMRLALEANVHFAEYSEIQLAGICILLYGFIEDPTGRHSFLDHILSLESGVPLLLGRLLADLRVRWEASVFTGFAYLYLVIGKLNEARRCFEHVTLLRPDIAYWPSIDLNVARAFFSVGCLARIENQIDIAIAAWQSCIDFAKDATAVKTFNHYYKIEETREMWGVALAAQACVSQARLSLGKGNSIDETLRSRMIRPSEVCPYLCNLDDLFRLHATC